MAEEEQQLERELHELRRKRVEAERRLRSISRASGSSKDGEVKKRERPMPSEDKEPPSKRLPSTISLSGSVLPKSKIASTVVSVEKVEKPRSVTIMQQDSSIRARNRKMFGVLLGTLEKFQKEDKARQAADAAARRRELENEVESKYEEERKKILEELAVQREAERAKEEELAEALRKEEDEKRIQLLKLKWEKHHNQLKKHSRTKFDKPAIYYLPAKSQDENENDEAKGNEQANGSEGEDTTTRKRERSEDSSEDTESTVKDTGASHDAKRTKNEEQDHSKEE